MGDPFSPYAMTGLKQGSSPNNPGPAPAINTAAGPTPAANAPLYSPSHPLFWAGAFILVTYGLIGANSAVRLGKFKVSANAGTV